MTRTEQPSATVSAIAIVAEMLLGCAASFVVSVIAVALVALAVLVQL